MDKNSLNFLKKYQQYDDEIHISIWCLCSFNYLKQYFENIQFTGKEEEIELSLLSTNKNDLNKSNYEKSLNIFKLNENEFKFIEKIQILSNLKSKFMIPILFKYLDMISIFKLVCFINFF